MTQEQGFGLAELVERSGVPAATIRHWVSLGLCPEPVRLSANRFAYNETHVEALSLVRSLRERRNLPLEVIREILPELMADLDQAFRAEAWEDAVNRRLGGGPDSGPATRLLEVAVAAFDARGYGEVTVDDLCTAAGLAKGSFYRYYPSKEDLFFRVVDQIGDESVAALEQRSAEGALSSIDAAQVLAESLGAHLPLILDLVSRMAQRRPGYPRVGRALIARLADAAGRLVEGGGKDPRLDRESGLALLGAGMALAARPVIYPDLPPTGA